MIDGSLLEAVRLGVFAAIGGAGALFGMQKGYKALKGERSEGHAESWKDEALTVGRHEEECNRRLGAISGRLKRIETSLDTVQADVKEILKNGRCK